MAQTTAWNNRPRREVTSPAMAATEADEARWTTHPAHRKQQEGVQPSFAVQPGSPTEVAGPGSSACTHTPGPLRCKGQQPLAPTLVYCNSQMLLSVPVQTLSLFCCMCGSSCKGKPIVRVHKVVITELDLSFSYILAVWCKVKLGTIYLLQLLFWYWYFVRFPALTNCTSQ